MRYFIELSYRGTHYHGWQKQPNATTVQETLENALERVLRQPIELVGSSRTDTGVHAEQQMAHFDISTPLALLRPIVRSLNGILPFDIAVQKIWPVPEGYHARFAATHRCYEYRIVTQKNPFLTDLAYFFRPPLNLSAMNEAAALLLQYDDFECFSKTHTDVKTFICQIEYAYWQITAQGLTFYIKSNRFLRGMVRAIVGSLLAVGQGKLTVADFEQIILSKNRKKAAAQAPAHGLFLTEVGYENHQLHE
ncbi:MAG: tRNA pseudouridine(38-40) synthase TruA [Runella sp.]